MFNGEIYNYRELRAAILAMEPRVRFESSGDTEVLLRLFELHGPAMLTRLRGMFAFAIWDERTKRVFAARDSFGIKPLFVSDDGHRIRIASQFKVLRSALRFSQPEPAGHVGFFLNGYVPEPFTLEKSIRVVPAGTYFWVDSSGRSAFAPFDPDPVLPKGFTSGNTDAVSTIIADAVSAHLVADVDVGVFLSAGRDSTAIAAIASQQSERLRTFTLGFEEFRGSDHDETVLATRAAEAIGAEHETRWVRGADLEEGFQQYLEAMDLPSVDGANTYLVSHFASLSGIKVALSGVGADELCGGYPSFKQLPRLVRANRLLPISFSATKMVRRALTRTGLFNQRPKIPGILEYSHSLGAAYTLRRGLFMPWEETPLVDIFDADFIEAGHGALNQVGEMESETAGMDDFDTISHLETAHYMRSQLMRDSDWASMASSLELRTPFADVTLWAAARILRRRGIPLTKSDIFNSTGGILPSELGTRPKTGFAVPWMNDSTAGATRDNRFRGSPTRRWASRVYSDYMGAL